MGHLPIVNQSTVTDVIRDGHISTRGDLKEMWEKTTADIFSDVLATRAGDLVFPWIIAGAGKQNLGFKYVLTIAGPPIFVEGDEYPVKVPLSQEGWEFPNPLPEATALDLWDSRLLWNAIGKKSLRRGRSLTHQTPMEDQRLLRLLNSVNPGGPIKITLGKKSYGGTPVTIDPSQAHWDPRLERKLNSLSAYNRLSALDLNGIPWRRDRSFIVEKALEAWIMENIDKGPGKEFRENVLDASSRIEWFGNYLPFGVAGGNMDVVVTQSRDSRKFVTVIELKVASLRIAEFRAVADQVSMYCEFIRNAFKAYGEMIEPNGIVISGPSSSFGLSTAISENASIKWVAYSIDDKGNVHFTPVRR